MPRKYTLRVKGISEYRMKELEAFCRQYDEKKRKYNNLYTSSNVSPEVSVMGGVPGKPTENTAIQGLILKRDIDIIESSINEVCGGSKKLEEQLKLNVTRRIGYDKLGYVPLTERNFYKLRAKFFVILNEKK